MDTPICDFVRGYADRDILRLHMPGHKGMPLLGMEVLDITEVSGADSLYEADGIIARSEANTGRLFGCRTFYSAEGSSQCIRAMLYLVMLRAKRMGRPPLIAAGRNAHKTFLTAAALLDMDVWWLYPREGGSYHSCDLTPEDLDACLSRERPAAVYLTTPDYLGHITDISAMAEVCHKHDVLLAVDDAHGAYLRFLPEDRHPISLGADICCDSAHKTLPALTGAAYLHLSAEMDREVGDWAKEALALFGSTSPSYLILQSLDAVALYLEDYPRKLEAFLPKVRELKAALRGHGYVLYGEEPLKVTLDAKKYGYSGTRIAAHLRENGMEPEFADEDYLVLMLTPELPVGSLLRLEKVLRDLPRKEAIRAAAPRFLPGEQVLSIRTAMLSDHETLPADQCLGRILAVPTVGCPPAVPVLVCGEKITEHAIDCLTYYGIETCCVVKE